ncbi:CDP-alcohol phosphatidyltransferase family protein [bacterium]|nr:CDP-alcohol phosphatidyltransferase family protein [bacterium]
MNEAKTREPIPEAVKNVYYALLSPFTTLARRLDMNPNTFTTVSFIMGIVSAYFAATGQLRLAAVFILLSGVLDTVDGKLARESNKVTKFGALYDSTLDRYSEVVFFFGLAYFFISTGNHLPTVAVAMSLGGSLMVSYVRARAEGLGFDCKVGIMQRAERLLLLGIGGLIGLEALIIAVWIIAILSNVTAIHRIVHVWQQDQENTSTDTEGS